MVETQGGFADSKVPGTADKLSPPLSCHVSTELNLKDGTQTQLLGSRSLGPQSRPWLAYQPYKAARTLRTSSRTVSMCLGIGACLSASYGWLGHITLTARLSLRLAHGKLSTPRDEWVAACPREIVIAHCMQRCARQSPVVAMRHVSNERTHSEVSRSYARCRESVVRCLGYATCLHSPKDRGGTAERRR